jgi:hypothetical protein
MDNSPKIDNAPGLFWRLRKNGSWLAAWHCRSDLARRGYPVRYWRIGLVQGELSEGTALLIQETCQRLQAEMLIWGRGGVPIIGSFDGTFRGLVLAYESDPDSPYRTLRYRTKLNYSNLCRRLVTDHGDELVADIKARTVLRWHEEWSAGGHVAMGHSMIGMLRSLLSFGVTFLEDEECGRLSAALHKVRFRMAEPRKAAITAAQVVALRAKAHEMGKPSIALAQALQFELLLRQRDVIGEWVPNNEEGTSDVLWGSEKWIRGLRWSEIDQNLILRHTTSKRGKDIEVDLRLAPMVMEELHHLHHFGDNPKMVGPMIVAEANGLPYTAVEFRRQWRKVADAAGIPRSVFNMDSRAGGITEATDAGAELEHVRHAATHSNISMTERYSRGSVEKIAGVMRRRAEHRNKE